MEELVEQCCHGDDPTDCGPATSTCHTPNALTYAFDGTTVGFETNPGSVRTCCPIVLVPPIQTSNPVCPITYSCSGPVLGIGDICTFSSTNTLSTFNTETGEFSFTSTDTTMFGTQDITLTISASVGASTIERTVTLELTDPCIGHVFDFS